jgi:hypothetical protein
MHRRLLPSLFLAVALVVPAAARADFGVRAAYLVPMYVNTGQSVGGSAYTYGVGQAWLSNLDIIASWYPIDFLSVDVEGQFNLSGTDSRYPFTGIYVGPGVTLDLPLFLYARASLPILVTGDNLGSLSAPTLFLRIGGGLKLELLVIRLYLEVTADFAYAGSGISFFGSQTINIAAGIWFKF